MKYAIYFIILAALCIWAAVNSRHIVLQFILSACALCCMGIAVAFAIRRPTLLLKDTTGRMPIVSYLVYWPYFMLNTLLLGSVRLVGKANAYDEIIPGLYLGRRLFKRDCPTCFSTSSSFAVLDLTAEFSECAPIREADHYLCLPLLDTTEPTHSDLITGTNWLAAQHKDRPVYVHCALGNSRSATIVAAYLLKTGHCLTPQDAIKHIQAKRPGIGPNQSQLAALQHFDHSIKREQV